ncbi:hypothetical protein PTKIN_Ptkin09bG0277800 [Pterospermum kingtungense]
METDKVINASFFPASEILSQTVEAILETMVATNDVLFKKDSFKELATYLERIVPILKELNGKYISGSVSLNNAIQIINQEIKAAKQLTLECGTKSKVYLLMNSHGIVSVQKAEFKAAIAEEEILEKIETGIQERHADRSYANNLLILIAEAVGIPTDRSSLKREFEAFKSEIENVRLRKDKAEAIQMNQIIALLGRADAASSPKEKEMKYFTEQKSLGSQPLEPLQSFYCPITLDVMVDPVETSSGLAFERSAIEAWFAAGNNLCRLTLTPLDTSILRPNKTLRQCIEEWKGRNTMITIASMKPNLTFGDEGEVLHCLGQLKDLCEQRDLYRELVILENYIPLLIQLLGGKNCDIRNRVLAILQILTEDSDDAKFDPWGAALMKGVDSIGKVQGCILLLVAVASGDDYQAARDAGEVSENLSFSDQNIIQMARANYIKYLLQRLSTGPEDVKLIMATTVAEIELTDHNKVVLVEGGALGPLLDWVSHGGIQMKSVAVRAVRNLSSVPKNGLQMIKEGALRPLRDLLRLYSSSSSIREQVAATIMHLAVSTMSHESNETAISLLESDDDIFMLFSLISLTGPEIQQNVLQIFHALCQSPSAANIKTKLTQCSAIQVLVQLCECDTEDVRPNAVKLFCCLSSNDEEEIASAVGIISNLPENAQITQWLVDAGAIPIIFQFLGNGRHNDSHRVHLLDSGTTLTKKHAATSLCRLSMSSFQLSWKIPKYERSRWSSAPPKTACQSRKKGETEAGSGPKVKAGASGMKREEAGPETAEVISKVELKRLDLEEFEQEESNKESRKKGETEPGGGHLKSRKKRETGCLDWPLKLRKKGKTESRGRPSKLRKKGETEAGGFRPKIKARASGTKGEEAGPETAEAISEPEVIPVYADVEVTKEIATNPVEEPSSATEILEIVPDENEGALSSHEIETEKEEADKIVQVTENVSQSSKPAPTGVSAVTTIERSVSKILECMGTDTVRRIVVHGVWGVGKSSVLRALANNLKTRLQFDLIISVTVSKYWSPRKIKDQIIQQLPPASSNADSFQILKSMKFLLLLDDVWEQIDLQEMSIPDPSQVNGSVLILATRDLKVCHDMKEIRVVEIEPVSKEEAWKLFHEQVGGLIYSPSIQHYAQGIVEGCCGLPLLIIVTGRALAGEINVPVWQHAFNEFSVPGRDIKSCIEDLIQLLKLSFDRLKSRSLKSCFPYCALFLQDEGIYTNKLIEYCIQEGLIAGSWPDAYERGYDIVNALLHALFLETSDNGRSIRMPDLIRDLALGILSQEEGSHFLLRAYSKPLNLENHSLLGPHESTESNRFFSPDAHKFILRAGSGLTKAPSLEEWEKSKMIFLMDNKLSTLPERPNCPDLLTLFLQRNSRLRVIPLSFFDCIPCLKVLNLSNTRIKCLPKTISKLISLETLILCHCERLAMLPSDIGSLKLLQVLDLRGTEINILPDEIGELDSLKYLDICFYGSIDCSEYIKLPQGLVSGGIISRLHALESLGISVFPGDERWSKCVKYIIDEIPDAIVEVLARCSAFYLDHHLDICSISEFGIGNISKLKYCVVSECPGLKAIVDDGNFTEVVFPCLERLSIHHLWNLEYIWEGVLLEGSFAMLRTLHVHACPKLKYVFKSPMLRFVSNLEELIVDDCTAIEKIIFDDMTTG